MAITQTVDIPADYRLTIDVPREVPVGPVILTFTPAEADSDEGYNLTLSRESGDSNRTAPRSGDDCPLCAQYRHPESGRLVPNAETIAAIEEGRAMMRGEIPAKRYSSAEEMWADLDKDDPED